MSNIINFNKQLVIGFSQSWTCPAGVYVAYVILAGAGGGGYFYSDSSSFWYATGGGGGQVKAWPLCVSPGTTYIFVIGLGGTGYRNLSNVNGSATAGGNSYVYIQNAFATTLNSNLASTTAVVLNNFTSTAGLSAGSIILIGSEQMLIKSIDSGTQCTVVRGYNGTTAATHNSGDNVYPLSLIMYALGGAPGVQLAGGNGGGADTTTGAGANLSTHTAALNGEANISGGGGGAQSISSNGGLNGGNGPGPAAMGGLSNQMATVPGNGVGGGGGWGPGGSGDAPAINGTGGGGGSGRNGGNGVGAVMWQGA